MKYIKLYEEIFADLELEEPEIEASDEPIFILGWNIY